MIEDIGTAMDICDYADEKSATVTLAEGAAKVLNLTGNKKEILKAGQQGLLDGSNLDVQEADVEAITAWKNGYFRFNKADIHTIMLQLSRWYDAEVSYEEGTAPHYFGAIISRDNNISQILHMLEATGEVHFKVNGKKITVMP